MLQKRSKYIYIPSHTPLYNNCHHHYLWQVLALKEKAHTVLTASQIFKIMYSLNNHKLISICFKSKAESLDYNPIKSWVS